MKKNAAKGIRYVCLFITGILLVTLFGGLGQHIRYQDMLRDIFKLTDSQESVVLLNNHAETIPVKLLNSRKIASVNIGYQQAGVFDNMLRNFASVKSFTFDSAKSVSSNLSELKSYNTLIIQVTPESLYQPHTINFILQARKQSEVIIAGFGHTGSLQRLDHIKVPVIWSPAQSAEAADSSAQIIFGGIAIENRLSAAISPNFQAGTGYSTAKIRLGYSAPEEAGINSTYLNKIDNIVNEAISSHATPSAVVMVVKDGLVIFNKAYGSHTYDGTRSTKTSDIYDVASVTKTAATTMAVMSLYEKKKLDLYANIGSYLPEAKQSNKSQATVREVMLHQAGFINIDFPSKIRSQDHSSDSSSLYPVKVSDNYYLRKNFYYDVMWPHMLNSPIKNRGKYVYSDLSMYVMKEIVEHQSGVSLDEYVADQFYKPLGMGTAGFNPRQRFNKDNIVPTEQDNYFRKTLLQGYVHDQGAAMANGISGHAGLFASANDLAILNQMLLNGGTYGGVEYFKPETVNLFTERQSNVSHRGFGFDRSDPQSNAGYPSKLASSQTYGHTGYTGTCVWVDPKHKLIYIFLSNRVNPSVSERLSTLRIRPRIQDAIYEAINKGMSVSASR